MDRNADQRDVVVSQFLSEVIERRKGLDTRPTPDRPDVQQDDLSLERGPVAQRAVEPRGVEVDGKPLVGFLRGGR